MSKKASYYDGRAVCPYYRYYDRNYRRICCEGYTSSSTTSATWRYASQSDRHFARYCAGDYSACRMCKAISDKYKDK